MKSVSPLLKEMHKLKEKIILWKIPNNAEIKRAENVDLNQLIEQGCDWVCGYLQNNPNLPKNDKHLCDRVGKTESNG